MRYDWSGNETRLECGHAVVSDWIHISCACKGHLYNYVHVSSAMALAGAITKKHGSAWLLLQHYSQRQSQKSGAFSEMKA